MSGSIRPKGPDRWELRVDAGADPLTGRRRQVSRTVDGGKRAAQRALSELEAEVRAGRQSAPAALTVGELLDRWLELLEGQRSPTTLREYRRIVERRLRPALGRRRIRQLTTAELDTLYGLLGAELSPASVRQVHAVIRRALVQGQRWGWVETNVATLATMPAARRSAVQPPSPDEAMRLVRLADETDPEFATFVRLAAATGARRGELCGLRWSDVDLVLGELRIERSVFQLAGAGVQLKDTKTHSARRVSLDPGTVDALVLHQVRALERWPGVEQAEEAYVFSDEVDGSLPWRPDRTSLAFGRLRRRAGLDHVRLHDLRHMHATYLLAGGAPLGDVSRRLGHGNSGTTLGIYSHAAGGDRAAADLIGRLLADDRSPDAQEPRHP